MQAAETGGCFASIIIKYIDLYKGRHTLGGLFQGHHIEGKGLFTEHCIGACCRDSMQAGVYKGRAVIKF